MLRASIVVAIFFCLASSPAQAATRYLTTSGSDSAACTQAAPCKTFGRGYAVAATGDTVQVAAGTYPAQTVTGGSKAVMFQGDSGVIVRSMVVGASNLVFDGINIDANNAQVLGVEFGGANSTWKNASIGNVVDEKGMLATSSCTGCTLDNVNFHDVLLMTGGIHNECLYSQAPNITIKNSRFTNCATMDVFFTRGTWWGQPYYGGWTLTNNFFGAPRYENGRCCMYYSVYWAYQETYDRAVVRNNTFEQQVTMDGSFTNSFESCNTPAFDLPGMTKQSCDGGPTPTPTPSTTPSPTPTPGSDTQAPTVPQGMAWNGTTQSSISVRWDASTDNRGVTGYRLYRNNVAIGTTTSFNYTASGLACGTSYTIGLAAFDAAGNESNRAEATGTTSTAACAVSTPEPPAPTPESTPEPPTPTPTATPTGCTIPIPARCPNLVGAWGFDQTSGTKVTDVSQATNDGKISGATSIAAGKYGRALSFDGVNDYVTVSDDASLDLSKGMTIEAWVNPSTVSEHRTVAFKENRKASHQAYSLYASNDAGKSAAEVAFGTKYTSMSSGKALPSKTWTHVAATYDGATLRIFHNGVQAASKSMTGSFTTTGDPLKFGGNAVWSEWFKGSLDEIRVWKVARKASEIQTDMNTAIS